MLEVADARYPCSACVCVSKIGKLGKMEIIEVKISDLSQDPANARKHDERNLAATIASFRRFGQQHPIVIDRNNIVRAGNCRLDAAEALGWDTIKAVRSDLSGSDAIAYAIADNRTSELAEWDEDILAAQLQGLLTDDEALLEAAGFDEDELAAMLDELGGDGTTGGDGDDDNPYTGKIEAPIYEPKGERPPVADLSDKAKTNELCDEIEATKLPDEVRDFLLTAAQRHTVFNFRNIAEYYCHAPKEVQHLMERSGLIIIDFQKAVQNGFVHLSERLGAIADLELGEVDNDS